MSFRPLPQPHSVKENFFMNVILKMSAFVFPLITFPYISRVLGAAGNGKIAFASSVVSYFSMFAQLGIPTYGVRVCAECRNDPEKLNRTVQELLILNSVTVFVTYMILCICVLVVPRFHVSRTLLIIYSSTILLNAVGMDWLFQALEQYRYITIRNLAFKTLGIVLIFVFVRRPEDFIIYGMIDIIGTYGSNILNVFYAGGFLNFHFQGNYNFKRHLRPVFNFFMMSVSISIYTSMDSVMLGFLASDTEVGYYAAATKMKMMLVSVVTALGGVLLPRMSHYVATGRMEEFYVMIKKSLNYVIVLTITITIYFLIMADIVIDFLAGEGYAGAVMPMRIVTVTIILIGLSHVTGMQILVPTSREKWTTISSMAGAAVNVVINALTIPALGAAGVAVGTVFAEGTVLIVQASRLKKEIGRILPGIQLWKIGISNATAGVILIITRWILPFENCFLVLCITSIIFFGVYVGLLLALREPFVTEYSRLLKDRFLQLTVKR